MKRLSFLFIFLSVISVFPNAFAFNDTKTHPKLTTFAFETSRTGKESYFQNHLFLKNGSDTIIVGNKLIDWIKHGAQMEDDPPCRASNHFHNPYLDWAASGLTDIWWLTDWWCWATSPYPPEEIKSNVTWATGYDNRGYIDPNSDVSEVNAWDWQSARSYFYTFLTGLDSSNGQLIAPDEQTRNLYLADTLRALGQVMHLVQDTAVPAHVRNDYSQGHTRYLPNHEPTWNPQKWFGNLFEDYVRFKNDQADWFSKPSVSGDFMSFRITDLWDTNILRPDTTTEELNQISMSSLGLAEYTTINFLSTFTIFNTDGDDGPLIYPYPKPEHCVIRLEKPQNVLTSFDRQYLASWNGHPGETVNKLAVVGYVKYYRDLYFPNISNEKLPIGLDEDCFEEYAQKLIPRAIGYSAQLLDYFFRGSMDAKNLSVTFETNGTGDDLVINAVTFDVVNTTPSATQPDPSVEPMQNGTLDLVCRYNPPGGGDMVYQVVKGIYTTVDENDPINNEYVSLTVPLDQSIPIDASDLTFTLVYRGVLGNETDAVAAAAIPIASNSRIAYYHQPGGPPNLSNVYASFADGTDERAITANTSEGIWYFEPAWSLDGTRMAISKQTCGTTNLDGYCVDDFTEEIAIVDLRTFNIISTISLSDSYFGIHPKLPLISPAFSRDGSKISAIVDKLDMGFNGIVVYDLDSKTWHYLNGFEFWKRKMVNGSAPAWSPVRDEILYYVHQQPDPVSDEIVLDRDIYLIDANGSNNRRLTDDDYANIQPSWSPGGDWIVFASDRDGEGFMDLWIMDREGGNIIKIRDCAAGCYHPNFSPDGMRLAFEESGDIYSMELIGSNLKKITNLGYKTTSPSWSPYLTKPTLHVEAGSATVNPGEAVTLSWVSDHADLAELNDGTDTISINTTDTMLVYPNDTTIYTIQVTGLGGRAAQAVTINVTMAMP